MQKLIQRFSLFTTLGLIAAIVFLATPAVNAQCPELISGLLRPLGIVRSNQGNLIVSESGTTTPNTGRISIVDPAGNRRTLLDSLPSGITDVGDPGGPASLFMQGRTLYVAISVGDVGRQMALPPPLPPVVIPNPNPLSSPLFSSILAIHFSATAENITTGFELTLANQNALAVGQTVTLSNGGADKLTIRMVVDFPNYTPNPLPFFAGNIRLSNPFGLVVVDDLMFVTDGGQNMVRKVDLEAGTFSTLATFPTIPNPLLPVGPPVVEAVPTGIRYVGDQLLVTLFRGAPFPPGSSVVEQIDPETGAHAPFISGLKTAIAVLPVTSSGDTDYLVLQHAAATGPFFPPPGSLVRFDTPTSLPSLVTDCVTRPTSMSLDTHTQKLYISELGGRIVSIPFP